MHKKFPRINIEDDETTRQSIVLVQRLYTASVFLAVLKDHTAGQQ